MRPSPSTWEMRNTTSTASLETGCRDGLQAGQIDKKEFLRKGEVLHQQPMAGERRGGIGDHSLIRSKAGGAQRRGGQRDRGEPRSRGKIPHHDAIETAEKEFVEYVDQPALAIKIEAQLVDLQRLKADVGRAAEAPGGWPRPNRWSSPPAAIGWAHAIPRR